MSADSAELLRKAAEVIEARGWTQYVAENDEGQVCALGALDAAYGQLQHRVPGYACTLAARDLGLHVGSAEVWRWNDRPERTAAEVIKTMRETADEVEFL